MMPSLFDIKLHRTLLGISQKELAGLANVTQGTIAKIEKGKMIPNYNLAKKIFEEIEYLERREEKKAKDIMIRPVTHLSPTNSLKKAAHLMSKKGISNLPVVKNRIVIGRIRDRTILNAGEKNYEKLCEEFMESPPTSVSENTSALVVKEILKHESCVVVVGKQGKLKGIISRSDFL